MPPLRHEDEKIAIRRDGKGQRLLWKTPHGSKEQLYVSLESISRIDAWVRWNLRMIQDDLLFIRAGVDGSTVSVLSVMANSGKDQDRTQLTTAAFTSVCIVMFQTVLTEVFWWTSVSWSVIQERG